MNKECEDNMPYQTFSDQKGGSDSPGKLKALKLPDLEGKSVLDIGCNEGFFCVEAKKQGATRVVGIDKVPAVIEAARQRAPDIDFRCQTWDTLPEGPFDVITCFHYLQRDLFPKLGARLTPGGLLIVEIATRRNLERHAKPSARFLLEEGELPRLLEPLELAHYQEGWIGDHALARAVARRSG